MNAMQRRNIAVVGSGVSGLSAAWLLSRRHQVTLYEADGRIGGHGHTVDAPSPRGPIAVDTGFIVYNERTYPNLIALLGHLGVATKPSDMSFAVSLDDGALEYNGTNLRGLFAQPSNLLRPRFWSMMSDLLKFYRNAARDVDRHGLGSLEDYLAANGYGAAFREDHLFPMAAAIWSTPAGKIGEYPAAAMIRFCENHGLLQVRDRPQWRTIDGGSRAYIKKLASAISGGIRAESRVTSVRRVDGGAVLEVEGGRAQLYDDIILASHADQSLAVLVDASPDEKRILGAFRYGENTAILHSDPALMPRRRAAWASWNYLARRSTGSGKPCITYWMNNLQGLPPTSPLFVTLNPDREPRSDLVVKRMTYEHPLFDAAALAAQDDLWSLQGRGGIWFCGAYFGAGFHEDGLQAGLAVAEQLGGVRRPWTVANESGRIKVTAVQSHAALEIAS
jgi:predicted NAD/FAD-binding protein